MERAEFASKFGLIQRAMHRAGEKLPDQHIGAMLFLPNGKGGEKAFNAAKVKWSQCKRGWRDFDDDRLTLLFQVVGTKLPRLRDAIPADAFHQPIDWLQRRLVAAGLLGAQDLASAPPLAEQLQGITTSGALLQFLAARDHTIAWSRQFREAFDLVPEHQEHLIRLFCHAVEECTGVRGRGRVLTLAAGTLTYVWDAFTGRPEIRKLGDALEPRIGELEPGMVLMAEPLSYIATLHGRHGAFRRNIERMITDPHWRQADFRERLHYCAVVANKPLPTALARRVAVGANIAQHLHTRQHLSQILCHDVGRVIEVYPALIRYKTHRALAEEIKEGTLKRLADADIPMALRARAEDLMEGRVSA